jgi:hypothetical protein
LNASSILDRNTNAIKCDLRKEKNYRKMNKTLIAGNTYLKYDDCEYLVEKHDWMMPIGAMG